MTGITDEQLAEIKARCEAATEGPWEYDERVRVAAVYSGERRNCFLDWEPNDWLSYYKFPVSAYGEELTDEQRLATMRFIAHAREDIPALLAEVDRLRAENEVLRIQRDAAIDETYTTDAECWRLREQLAALRRFGA